MLDKNKEAVPQTYQEIVADKLSIFEHIHNISPEEIQEETVEKLSKLSMEDHIKFIFMLPQSIEDIVKNSEQSISEEDQKINNDLAIELREIKRELSKYDIGNPDQMDDILKFGPRCYDLRIRQSEQVNKLLYNFFKEMETTPSQLLIKGKQKKND